MTFITKECQGFFNWGCRLNLAQSLRKWDKRLVQQSEVWKGGVSVGKDRSLKKESSVRTRRYISDHSVHRLLTINCFEIVAKLFILSESRTTQILLEIFHWAAIVPIKCYQMRKMFEHWVYLTCLKFYCNLS